MTLPHEGCPRPSVACRLDKEGVGGHDLCSTQSWNLQWLDMGHCSIYRVEYGEQGRRSQQQRPKRQTVQAGQHYEP